METQLEVRRESVLNNLNDPTKFEQIQRAAQMLSKSQLVPKEFQFAEKKEQAIANVFIALDLADRLNASPFMVMQNLYIVYGKPSFSSTFLIASINSSGKFAPLRFELTGEGDKRSCYAWTTDKEGNRLESPVISIDMAKKEGWYQKNGSKWQTMPDIMLRYRSASFFAKLYAPEITMGMQTYEELKDIDEPKVSTTITDFEIVPTPIIETVKEEEIKPEPEPKAKLKVEKTNTPKPEPKEEPAKETIEVVEVKEEAKPIEYKEPTQVDDVLNAVKSFKTRDELVGYLKKYQRSHFPMFEPAEQKMIQKAIAEKENEFSK